MNATPSEAPHSGIVPPPAEDDNDSFNAGWNRCREEIIARLTSPVEGLEYETTAATRSRLSMSVDRDMHNDVRALLRDFDRQAAHIATLNAALAAEKERLNQHMDLIRRDLRDKEEALADETKNRTMNREWAERAEAARVKAEGRADRMASRLAIAKAALIASDHTRAFIEVDAALGETP
jgi:hypothetical protein